MNPSWPRNSSGKPRLLFCKNCLRPLCTFYGVALLWKVGLATRMAGVSFFRAFDEASEGPVCGALAGCGGQRGALGLLRGGWLCGPAWGSGLASGGWLGAVGWVLRWARAGGLTGGLAQGLCGGCAAPRCGRHGLSARGQSPNPPQKDVIAPRFSVAFVHTLSILPLRLPFGHW